MDGVIISLFVGVCVGQSIVMEVNEGKTKFSAGESATLRCIVHEPDKLEDGWKMKWSLRPSKTNNDVPIGTNSELDKYVTDLSPGHFMVRSTHENIDGHRLQVFSLMINGKF